MTSTHLKILNIKQLIAILSCLFLTCLTVAIIIYFGAVKPNNEELSNWVETQCLISNTQSTPQPCCVITDCQCNECEGFLDPCSKLNTTGSCCNGYHCCEMRWNTCCEEKCDSIGLRCREICEKCNPYCGISVKDQLCQKSCGTCYQLTTNVFISQIMRHQIITSKCSLNNTNCVDNWLVEWEDGAEKPCWFHKKNYNYAVRWSKPSRNIIAFVFMMIFVGIFSLAFLSLIIVLIKILKDLFI